MLPIPSRTSKRYKVTLEQVVKELGKRLRRAEFEMDEAYRECGDDYSSSFKWCKSRYEALQEMMWFIDPDYEEE